MEQQQQPIAVWDPLLRLFHWLLVAAVVGAFVTVKIGGNAMAWHGFFGVAVCGLIAFRLVWGVIGPETARFASFVRGPRAIRAYLRGEWHGIGHNPLGALSVVALLTLFALQALLGLFAYDEIAFRGPLAPLVAEETQLAITTWHRRLEPLLLLLVLLHVGAILFYRWVKRENLVRPMITGYRVAERDGSELALPRQAAPWRRRGFWLRGVVAIAVGVAAATAASGVWIAPPPPAPAAPTTPEW